MSHMRKRTAGLLTLAPAAICFGIIAGSANGAFIQEGVYQLSDHPDSNQAPPPYGIRIDELVDVTAGNDVFTVSFDHALSDVKMVVTATTIHIFGTAFGGRDVGGSYAADIYQGVYTIDFLYNVGVGLLAGDDDILVAAPSGSNFGTLTTPFGPAVNLMDYFGNPPGGTLQLGDEADDLGHRGFAGISGWGWLDVIGDEQQPGATRDFLFTAELIPTPGVMATFLLAPVAMLRRRR